MKNKRIIAAMVLALLLQMLTGGIVAESETDSTLPQEQSQTEEIIVIDEEPIASIYLEIKANSDIVTYNGEVQSVSGYNALGLDPGHILSGITTSASGT